MFWRVRISEDAGADCLESVGGNKKQVAKPSFLCNFQSKDIEYGLTAENRLRYQTIIQYTQSSGVTGIRIPTQHQKSQTP